MCIYTGVGYEAYNLKCPASTRFNPIMGYCTPSTIFPCTQIPPTTAAATTTEAPCTANGRFPIADPNCQMYYFCNINGPEPIKYQLKCPNDLRFDPKKQLCVRSDKCPVS
ncbi:hypothetical protein WN55_09990 [Dufourea novaeangliae]|uniref:Chitin-binding type-2 domain-containing protein n=1 Tax=Dufourea novaeangliae TaxID=178035 RepID=A0A154PAA3_DUFNO|nr:hypothetical protein WN55_09990 [Dufourea novaeangliae]